MGAPTILNLEWTNQHGCGDGDLNCNIVLQYMCRPSGQKIQTREIRNGKIINVSVHSPKRECCNKSVVSGMFPSRYRDRHGVFVFNCM